MQTAEDVSKSGNTNLFHDLKQNHSLENAETKKLIFLLRYFRYFVKEIWLEKCKEFKNVKCLSCSDYKEWIKTTIKKKKKICL